MIRSIDGYGKQIEETSEEIERQRQQVRIEPAIGCENCDNSRISVEYDSHTWERFETDCLTCGRIRVTGKTDIDKEKSNHTSVKE